MVRKALLIVFFAAGWAKADTGFYGTVRVSEQDNSPACTVGQLNVSNGSLTCNGQVANITTGGGGGGGGGPSTLEVFIGAARSSPTASISANPNQFIGTVSGSTFTFTLNSSSVTLQGNSILFTNLNSSVAALGVSTGTLASQFPVSLSTGVVGILPVANGGTNTATPGLVAGTNITSITGTWPNQTINAATQSGGGGGSSTLAVTTGSPTGFVGPATSSPTAIINFSSNTFNVSLKGGATAYVEASNNMLFYPINCGFSGGGAALSAGSTTYIPVEVSGTITGWTLLADTTGYMIVDVKRSRGFNSAPTTSVAGTQLPTLTNTWANQNLSLTTWTTDVAVDDKFSCVLTSATTVTSATLQIHMKRQ